MVPVFRTGSPDSASSPRPRFGLHAIARSNSERATAFVVDRRRQAAAALAMSRSSGLLTRGTTEAGPCCPSGLRPSTRQQQGYSVCASLSARFERSRRPDAPGDRTVAIGESGQKMGFCRAFALRRAGARRPMGSYCPIHAHRRPQDPTRNPAFAGPLYRRPDLNRGTSPTRTTGDNRG
jgi:hypothetical protein